MNDPTVVPLSTAFEQGTKIPRLRARADALHTLQLGDTMLDAEAELMIAESELGEKSPVYRRLKTPESEERLRKHFWRELIAATYQD